MTNTDFANMINSKSEYQELVKNAKVLDGLLSHSGVHAAGVVIGPGDLSDYVPLSASRKNAEPDVLVQFEGKWLDDLGILKMDFLGLNNLTIIKQALALIRQYKSVDIDIDNIALDDKKAYDLLSAGKTEGIFQFESDGMTKYLRQLKPNHLNDLIAMVALYRPGPMQYIDTYIARKHGLKDIVYDHPLFEQTLSETYGVTVYQEQVMQISRDIAGFSATMADTLRKAMGKKNIDLLNEVHGAFVSGATEKGLSIDQIEDIWSGWTKFAEYAFNKSHAAAYAFIAYQTAYLKANFPVEYMTAVLSLTDDPKKIPYYISATKKMNIDIIRPSINSSDTDFTIVDGKIIFGLCAIKNVGINAQNAIISERKENGLYTDFFSFVERVYSNAINKSVIESLIEAGVLDELPGHRAQKLASVENALHIGASYQKQKNSGQLTIFEMMAPEEAIVDTPKFAPVEAWDDKEMLDREKKILGFYASRHPLSEIEHLLKFYTNFSTDQLSVEIDSDPEATLEGLNTPEKIRIIGNVEKVVQKRDKRDNPFIIITLEDLYGSFEVSLFGKDFEKYSSLGVVGEKLYIVGHLNQFSSSNVDTILRLRPEKMMYATDIKKKVSGRLYINMTEADATTDFSDYLVDYAKKNNGRFKLMFNILTSEGEIVKTHSTSLSIQPTRDFDIELTDNRNLIYSCDWDDRD
jgi:DNA polymerase-3 subunit alpha